MPRAPSSSSAKSAPVPHSTPAGPDPDADVATVAVRVPRGREASAAWLNTQPPAAAADLLEATEAVHAALGHADDGVSAAPAELVKDHARALQATRQQHQEELRRLADELTPQIRSECERAAQRQLEGLGAHHASDVALLEAQVAAARADAERVQREMRAAAEVATQQLEEQRGRLTAAHAQERDELTQAREEVERLRGDRALVESRLRGESDARLRAAQQEHEARVAELREILGQAREATEAGAAQLAAQMREQYEAQLAAARDEAARREAEAREAREAQVEGSRRIEHLFGALCGNNSTRKGEVGEAFVKRIHDAMQLGTLASNGRIKAPGFADHTWEYAPPAAADASSPPPPLTALVEVKFSHDPGRARDVGKFDEDVRVGVTSRRINGALYLSLVERLAGRPRMSFEVLHGVPTLWVSRAAEDDLSAATMVEMAFLAFAQAWPLLCATQVEAEDAAGAGRVHEEALRRAGAFVHAQMREHEKLDPRIASLEKVAEQLRRETLHLRKLRDGLFASAYQFQAQTPAAFAHLADAAPAMAALAPQQSGSDELPGAADPLDDEAALLASAAGQAVAEAIRRYHAGHHKRYPKTLQAIAADLPADVRRVAAGTPALYPAAERLVRNEEWAKRTRKRRLASSSAHDDEEPAA